LQSQLAQLSTGGGQGIVTVDDQGIILAWNQEATDIFGWSPAESLSKNISALVIPPEHVEAHEAAFTRWKGLDRPPRSQPLIFRARNKWGEQFPIDVSLSGWKSNGGRWHVTATMRRRNEKFD
jgi:PAS domain S-box-containing protein